MVLPVWAAQQVSEALRMAGRTDDPRMHGAAVDSAACLRGTSCTPDAEAVVDAAELEGITWDTFVRREREKRGGFTAMAANGKAVYKQGRDGDHLAWPFAIMVASVGRLYPGGRTPMSDHTIGNIVSQHVGSEAQTAALLSGIRVLCAKAFGEHLPQLRHEKETTKQLMAMAKQVRAKEPRYSRPVNFGTDEGVWMSIVREHEEVSHLRDDSTRKAKALRDHAIFLERHDTISRSDYETKCDVRLEQYFRAYDERGQLQNQPRVSQQLNAVLVGDGGRLQRNYLDPKDPRKKGRWSETVETRPLRVSMLVDPNTPYARASGLPLQRESQDALLPMP